MPNNSAESKRRQRERNGPSASKAGSSGITKQVEGLGVRRFDDIADELVKGVDLEGKLTGLVTYANGSVGITVVMPAAYSMDAMRALQESRRAFTMFRLYHAPIPGSDAEPDHK